jgi:hypothetical protein
MTKKYSYISAFGELDFGEGKWLIELDAEGFPHRQLVLVDDQWYWADKDGSSDIRFFLGDQPIDHTEIIGAKLISQEEFDYAWKIAVKLEQ